MKYVKTIFAIISLFFIILIIISFKFATLFCFISVIPLTLAQIQRDFPIINHNFAIVLAVLIAFMISISFKFLLSKNKKYLGICIFIGLIFLYSISTYFVSELSKNIPVSVTENTTFFNEMGIPLFYYSIASKDSIIKKIKFFAREGIDPFTGEKLLPVNKEIIKKYFDQIYELKAKEQSIQSKSIKKQLRTKNIKIPKGVTGVTNDSKKEAWIIYFEMPQDLKTEPKSINEDKKTSSSNLIKMRRVDAINN